MSTAGKPAPFEPDLRAALVAMVRKRVPESEVEDIVQQALAEALDSPHAPDDGEQRRRWIFGVAKNKVVDYHRRAGRESFDLPDVEGSAAPHVEADLLRWAERNLPEGAENRKTLDWMLREGEGEKLESIAASEKLPPPRVRQRVSRLRRHFKENWQREVAMLAALGVVVGALVLFVLKHKEPEPITHEVVDPRAEPLRRVALEKCVKGEWKPCVDGLDEARRLDPAGDARPEVQQARQAAGKALLAPPPPPPVAPSALPTTAPPEPSTKLMPGPGPQTAKPGPTELSSVPPPPPAPTPAPSYLPLPSKSDGPVPQNAKPVGKKAVPSKAGSSLGSDLGSKDFAPEPPVQGTGGFNKK